MQEEQMKLQFQQEENDKERRKDITVAEIRSAGYGAGSDIDQNQQSDYLDALDRIQDNSQYREQMDFKREQSAIKNSETHEKMEIERDKMNTQKEIANKNLEIARENKNKYDVESKKKSKKKTDKE